MLHLYKESQYLAAILSLGDTLVSPAAEVMLGKRTNRSVMTIVFTAAGRRKEIIVPLPTCDFAEISQTENIDDIIEKYPNEDELQKFIGQEVKDLSIQLAPYKRPVNIVVRKEPLPRTSTRDCGV